MTTIATFGLKFIFSKKATKIEKIFTVFLTLCSKCQIDGEDFVNFCGLFRKHKLYLYVNLVGVKNLREGQSSTFLRCAIVFGVESGVHANIY